MLQCYLCTFNNEYRGYRYVHTQAHTKMFNAKTSEPVLILTIAIFFLHFGHTEIHSWATNLSPISCRIRTKRLGLCLYIKYSGVGHHLPEKIGIYSELTSTQEKTDCKQVTEKKYWRVFHCNQRASASAGGTPMNIQGVIFMGKRVLHV
jgi:hypothetical protein